MFGGLAWGSQPAGWGPVPTWPTPDQVPLGVNYGPTGAEYTGTAQVVIGPSAADIAAQVTASLQATTIPVNLTKVKGQAINGAGTLADPWGPA